MDMIPDIRTIKEKKLIGKRIEMTFANDRTFELWKSFMPRQKEITNAIGTDLYSMQVYPPTFDFNEFNLYAPFSKWAAIEVTNFERIPDEMEAYTLAGGLYAVFIHKGAASDGPRTFKYIFETWLPTSGYAVDDRTHFEILGSKYKNEDPDSEEEIWVPIVRKGAKKNEKKAPDKKIVISSEWNILMPVVIGSGLLIGSIILAIASEQIMTMIPIPFAVYAIYIGSQTAQVAIGDKKIFINLLFKEQQVYPIESFKAITQGRSYRHSQRYEINFENGDRYSFQARGKDYFPNPWRDLREYYTRSIHELAKG